MSEQQHKYLHARWRRTTSEPVTVDRRVRVFDEVSGDDGWADVHWSNTTCRLGVVRDEHGTIIDPRPTFVP